MESVTHIYRAWKTVLEMLRDRGYITSEEDHNTTLEGFKERFYKGGEGVDHKELTIKVVKENDATDGIIVFFAEGVSLKTDVLGKYLTEVESEHVKRAIIVYRGKLSSPVKQMMEQPREVKWEALLEDELIVNVTHHILVPQHILLSPEEKQELLKKYQVKESQLPRLLTSDPISKYYGFQRGDVVKIIRKSETAGRYVTYRAVF
ncbi:RNA polymerase Rpb5 domain containing protein [Entamoeba histolytica HM-1:IMSS-B]|uniref:RNA polymerase subunit Rpb5, putative n=8 Tax=Entamoeba TaxID=5758 RepID=C4LW54_ENTH1|nr:RNA polymerase Rpb5, C-terminal domain containing protein [Entamoeba nuttalli P19]XP_650770.1 RNA polymerase subunit Rpb5, putative [Entamoeba histolytica HM-1:IMSS]EMD45670.1 RNA polymerase subunit Rpb5, putative [Entamoeba histolytica KU27]EMH75621.1 RNA polymerase Rpb5 domain containing protein [Entamoeba histolytica HM-1:IMSS-B]EMS14335.1 RNA polymerase subunit Rpb5, putative [Entamoeba histolytica HM-3:IMSS]ENY65045.1 RNA polymerase subunit Rpb5, putative [Entamoeba histolytica HM-1:IM|eukprot:XP_008854786.1 RNA polymerase Rpb5, C-terminal domain containing protein [Entamoeba nuttalli P19]